MKIDRRKPAHWWYLAYFGAMVLAALLLRPFRRRVKRQRVVLYGHRLGGNLLALYRPLRADHRDRFEVSFLAFDPDHVRELKAAGEVVVPVLSLRCAWLLASADAVISDHGLHAMLPLLWWSDIRFFDVWHGIAFKGFDADDFRVQHRYDEVWVASPLQHRLYLEQYGFDPARVQVTGYARTDRLAREGEDLIVLRRGFGLPERGLVILFAPTWKQDAAGRSLYPFGLAEEDFLGALSRVATRTSAVVVMRTHLNSTQPAGEVHDRVVQVPYARYPDTEGLLLVSDVLICDWSSIAFDYLILGRPTFFLDVEPPFRKGFSLGPEYRFGSVVDNVDDLCAGIEIALTRPIVALTDVPERQRRMREAIYGGFDDGRSAERCIERLALSLERESSRSPQ